MPETESAADEGSVEPDVYSPTILIRGERASAGGS